MTPTEFAAIANALAWPVVVLATLVAFADKLRALLDKLTQSLSVKSVKLKALGGEIELTVEQAKNTLDEQLKAIADASNELTEEELDLFEKILEADGKLTVAMLIQDFKRNSHEHNILRRLRDRMLVAPSETGNWQPGKHPVPTRFGKLVHQLKQLSKSTKGAA